MTDDDRARDAATPSAGDESSGRILDDKTVAELLSQLARVSEQLLTDVDQLHSDVDDELVTIASQVAWLIAQSAEELQLTATELQGVLDAETARRGYPIENRP